MYTVVILVVLAIATVLQFARFATQKGYRVSLVGIGTWIVILGIVFGFVGYNSAVLIGFMVPKSLVMTKSYALDILGRKSGTKVYVIRHLTESGREAFEFAVLSKDISDIHKINNDIEVSEEDRKDAVFILETEKPKGFWAYFVIIPPEAKKIKATIHAPKGTVIDEEIPRPPIYPDSDSYQVTYAVLSQRTAFLNFVMKI